MSLPEWLIPVGRTVGGWLGSLLSFFQPPSVEIIADRTGYGRLKIGGATDTVVVRVLIRFMNELQRYLPVRGISLRYHGAKLEPLHIPPPSLPGILREDGWDYIEPQANVYEKPFTIPPASSEDRYVFFTLPPGVYNSPFPINCSVTVDFAGRRNKTLQVKVSR